MIFLIEYDRASGTVTELRKFDASSLKVAEDARLELELKLNRAGVQHEVVLLDAPNEEALRRTHGRYFEDVETVLTKLSTSANGQEKNTLGIDEILD